MFLLEFRLVKWFSEWYSCTLNHRISNLAIICTTTWNFNHWIFTICGCKAFKVDAIYLFKSYNGIHLIKKTPTRELLDFIFGLLMKLLWNNLKPWITKFGSFNRLSMLNECSMFQNPSIKASITKMYLINSFMDLCIFLNTEINPIICQEIINQINNSLTLVKTTTKEKDFKMRTFPCHIIKCISYLYNI